MPSFARSAFSLAMMVPVDSGFCASAATEPPASRAAARLMAMAKRRIVVVCPPGVLRCGPASCPPGEGPYQGARDADGASVLRRAATKERKKGAWASAARRG